MDGVGLVICHNASFDRMFLESRIPAFANKSFACSFLKYLGKIGVGVVKTRLPRVPVWIIS